MLILFGPAGGSTVASTSRWGLVTGAGVQSVATERQALVRCGGSSDRGGAVSGAPGTAAGAAVSGLATIASRRSGTVRSFLPVLADRGAIASGLTESGTAAMVCGSVCVAAAGAVLGEEPPSEPAYGSFTLRNMHDLNVSAACGDICTVLSIRYAYDWAGGECRKALLLEAPDQIRRYGRISKTLELKWLSSPRQAYLAGERLLRYLSRPRWRVSFTAGPEYASIPPGTWVTVQHPHVPVSGRMLVLDSELDPASASVRLTVDGIAGDVPHIAPAKLSEAYAPQLPAGISVTYVAGFATFSIRDDDDTPLPGAKATLDGGLTLVTDSFGRVSFQTSRGSHHLKIEAAGFVTQELEVTV